MRNPILTAHEATPVAAKAALHREHSLCSVSPLTQRNLGVSTEAKRSFLKTSDWVVFVIQQVLPGTVAVV